MLAKGELSSDEFLTCVLDVLGTERTPGVVEPFLALALRAADLWTPTVSVPGQLTRLAGPAAALADHPDLSSPALRTLAASARRRGRTSGCSTRPAPTTSTSPGGCWSAAPPSATTTRPPSRRSLERDPDPEAWVRALGVTAARDDEDAKAEVWKHVFEKRSVPAGQPLDRASRRRSGARPSTTYCSRGRTATSTSSTQLPPGGLLAAAGLIRATFPTVGDQAFLDRGPRDGGRARSGPDHPDHPAQRHRHPGPDAPRPRLSARSLPELASQSSLRRSPDSSIGNRSSFCRSIAAPTRPANSGCGRVGRDRSSGCAWVAT